MRVIVAGGRKWPVTQELIDFVAENLAEMGAKVVVHGDATGADQLGRFAGEALGLPVVATPALWDRHGKCAGRIRNREMAEKADALLVLPGARGTAHMIQVATRRGMKIRYLFPKASPYESTVQQWITSPAR